MKKTKVIALVCFTFYLFHVMRNLTPSYFVGLILLLAFFFISFCFEGAEEIDFDVLFFFAFFAWYFASYSSLFSENKHGEPYIGLFRFWASFPLAIICLVLASDSVMKPMQALTFFFVLAALTLALQYIFGPVYWFAEASERAGGMRFASLVGSLTAYGVAVGVPGLAAFYYFKKMDGAVIILILIIGAALSMQKAALANIVLVIVFAWWLKLIELRKIFLYSILMTIVIAILSLYVLDLSGGQFESVLRYVRGTLTSETELSNDVNFLVSMIERLTILPREALVYFNSYELIYGAGVFGGAGALGYDNIPMAHNGIVELILIFGIFVGGSIIIFLVYMFAKTITIIRNRSTAAKTEIGFLSASYILWFTNYVFSGGGLFQPVSAAIFWLIVLRIRHIMRNERIA